MKAAVKLNVRDDQAYNVKLHVRHQYWKRRMEMRLMYWLCDELEAEVDIGHHDLALERGSSPIYCPSQENQNQ